MFRLNLPEYSFKLRNEKGKTEIFDPFRKKFIRLTPEEWVRQNFIQYLIDQKQYPAGRIALEKALKVNEMNKRTDAVIFDNNGFPLVIIECKAPEVKISQKTFDQIARYNLTLKVKYLIVTNGLEHYISLIDFENQNYSFLPEIPLYNELL